jgi:hypothetical protein
MKTIPITEANALKAFALNQGNWLNMPENSLKLSTKIF